MSVTSGSSLCQNIIRVTNKIYWSCIEARETQIKINQTLELLLESSTIAICLLARKKRQKKGLFWKKEGQGYMQ